MRGFAVIRRFSLVLLAPFVGMQLASASGFSDSGTLTKGSATVCHSGATNFTYTYGFQDGVTGVYSPIGVTGGETVVGIYDIYSTFGTLCTGTGGKLTIEGFSSNPGTMWLTSVTCNGVTLTSIGFSYTSGVGEWNMNGLFGFSGLANGAQISCTIQHN